MNPKVKTGLHLIPTHHRAEDEANWAGCPSTWQKLVYSGMPNLPHLKRLTDSSPDWQMISVRNHSLSEDKDAVWRDPIGTGRRHAEEWARHMSGFEDSRFVYEGVNEFPIWNPGGVEAQLQYELAFGQRGVQLGLPTMHAEFAVGWPGNGGVKDAPPNWDPWMPLLYFIRDTPDRYLGLHEYWGFNKGVMFYEGWWFLRYREMPVKVPTVLTELGGLKAYENPDGTWGLKAADGWMGDMGEQEYVLQWREAEIQLQQDNYLLGATTFTTDGGHPWIEECDCGPVNKYWVSWAQGQDDLEAPYDGPDDDGNDTGPGDNDDTPPGPSDSEGILDPKVLEAILHAESGNAGFRDGRLTIRIEAHLLVADWIGDSDAFGEHFKAGGPPNYEGWLRQPGTGEWVEYHNLGQNGEWMALTMAQAINPHKALLATSMGSSQVMGFNHGRIGFRTVEDQWEAFTRGHSAHAIGIVNYILSDPDLVTAVRARDWPTIGRLYNGSEAAGERYKAAYDALE